jgi:atrial natriuretic peptide receptor A
MLQVASGLPERSDVKKHVSEIATMALDLLHASNFFKVPYSKDEKVQIRIGIHTGSCGAGKTFSLILLSICSLIEIFCGF